MDEIIMHIARAVACLARLQIMSRLATEGELAPTTLARELHMPLHMVSAHLRRLVAAGLIQRRRSGVWAYCVARSPYGSETLSGRLSAWLFEMLKAPKTTLDNSGVGQLRNYASPEAQLHALIFEAATAFANVRRLQILRRLSSCAAVSVETLMAGLKMSDAAVSRHMSKLVRRGYVTCEKSKRVAAYCLAKKCRTPVHARLFEMVRAEWKKR